ncbi:hypothetical protein EJ05DRAFT_477636 [Pseudovirgaria hyperparasitica]|uniref:Uncharacterized protein n=1 Tax=Pseudovirgaria hyperparasitica TaxID=470096 RepID=A0A6A6W3J5_9PEZI|nr:uncharacterized protein EJ05DRAFT_477636 [Pseudovirgaria hyperparasitica]KAF2756500.1 hypothetical protein EJ05DRAFT_477636 [Pseudovirgaria hyperparasitica]
MPGLQHILTTLVLLTHISTATTASPIPNHTTSNPSPRPSIPITALVFDRAPGPKSCRGTLVSSITLTRPSSQHRNGTCYDMHHAAQCGVFVANKADACEARLYSMSGCPETLQEAYVTTVVFGPDRTARGGLWVSILVRCGVEIDEGRLEEEQMLLHDVFGDYVKDGGGR